MNTPNSEIKTPRTDAAFQKVYNKPAYAGEIMKMEMVKLEQELQQEKAIHAETIGCYEAMLENEQKLKKELKQAQEHIDSLVTDAAIDKTGEVEFLDNELKQAREELALAQKYCWNNMVCIHHTDKERAAVIGHCPVCVENQLSQWQECARELATQIKLCNAHPIDALSLFTQLNQEKK